MSAEVVAIGRTERLAELYLEHAGAAERLALILVSDRDLAQDLVQEAFVRVLGRFGELRKPEAFKAYLDRTVVNLCKKHYRRRSVERLFLQRERTAAASREREGMTDPSEVQMWEALQGLPLRQKTALALRFFRDLSEAQTAEVMQCSPAAVSGLVARGLEHLRARIPEGVE